MADISIENLLSGFYIRYQKLADLIAYSYKGSNCTNINLYIDLNSALHPLYQEGVAKDNDFLSCSCILNMCAHYRAFFKHYGVTSTIYLIYGRNCPKSNEKFVPLYNSKFINEYNTKATITDSIQKNLNMVNLLTQYIEKVYFFDIGRLEVSSFIKFLYDNNPRVNNREFENIIISRDLLMLQLVPYNFRVLRPTKTKLGDDSIIVDNSNMWYMYMNRYKKIKDIDYNIPNTMISNILALCGDPSRSIYSKLSVNKAFNIFHQAFTSGKINPNILYLQSTINEYILAPLELNLNLEEIDMRWRAINIDYQSTYIINLENPHLKRLRFIDLEDPKSLLAVINKNFTENPIDLERLEV